MIKTISVQIQFPGKNGRKKWRLECCGLIYCATLKRGPLFIKCVCHSSAIYRPTMSSSRTFIGKHFPSPSKRCTFKWASPQKLCSQFSHFIFAFLTQNMHILFCTSIMQQHASKIAANPVITLSFPAHFKLSRSCLPSKFEKRPHV